jgi:hypothetical protein
LIFFPDLFIDLFKKLLANRFLKFLLVQVLSGDLFILFHAVYEKTLCGRQLSREETTPMGKRGRQEKAVNH